MRTDQREARDAESGETSRSRRSSEARRQEAVGLAAAIDLDVVESPVVRLSALRPATLLGQGKVEEIKAAVEGHEAKLVVVDHPLSPIQQRNLERAWNAKVLDRTGLILEIFGARARTREGRLQVELAHLNYQKSRLVRSWTHLERQRGGFGFLGGPGETQIEADRRIITERIAKLETELESVSRTRALHRKTRKKVPHPVIALVGYTNAGKSTLFNRLTASDVFAQNLLFATLDPTLRRVRLPHGGEIILSDTVGFVSDLPTHLVAAFRATLEEVIEADLIVHVRDVAHEDTLAQARDVEDVLRVLGLDPRDPQRMIEVLNKIDLLDPDHRARLLADTPAEAGDGPVRLPLSAVTGEGVDRLLDVIEKRLNRDRAVFQLLVPPADGALLAWLYRSAEVLDRTDGEAGVALTARVPEKNLALFRRRAGRFLVAGDRRGGRKKS
ncbi:GTPase HflX [Prosthecomicrobium sp. N25]